MSIHSKSLIASAAMAVALNSVAPHRGMATPKADMSDPKVVIEQLNQAWTEFQAANDIRLTALDAKLEDVVTNEKVDRINASITDLTDAFNQIKEDQAQAVLAAGQNQGVDLAKEAFDFSIAAGLSEPISVEAYTEYRDGMNNYMRRGDGNHAIKAAMEVGNDSSGGYHVTPDTSGAMVTKIFETSPMRSYANIETIGVDKLEGFNDLEEGSQGWVGEKSTRPETDTPDVGKWSIDVHEQYANPRITQKLLDDSAFDVSSWLANKTSTKFARVENTAFCTGNGTLKPHGFLTYNTALTDDATRAWEIFQHVISGSNTAISDSDFLITLVYKLKVHFRNNANWFMNRNTLAAIRKLKDGDGNYLWQTDYTRQNAATLLGYGIAEFEDMPDMVANSLSIAFGDMRQAYTVVDRQGIRVLRDPFTAKPYVQFYTTKRVGGAAVNFEALKFMKFTT